ncbi:hypothetical protein SAMN05421640_2953 [Ekhidna lutea]|uniref:DUF4340 domain-containing protein n=1 Tax=Ekhidna lutea TaxID=447679 RepID=A0A239L3B0_EKHLU|nr:DUF4340 domain-containing protein [Ekhidna lutea]SNT25076.1 hypothetical protein SAMN05421640_2953 [Ekhidna lutea]
MSKTVKYILAITALLGVNLWLFLSDPTDQTATSEKYFQEEDMEAVSRFLFVLNGDTTQIERSEQGWTLNDEYKADEGFVNTLISILERVEAGRTIEEWDQDIMGSVEVEFDFNSRYRFQFASNPMKTKSYFIADGKAREVAVPGYKDNVVDIFTLHSDQWRDRVVVDGNWRTIQKIEVVNKRGEDFEITFVDNFFLVDEKQPTDSSSVVNYLNQFEGFQANEMLSKGRFENMDSLAGTEPYASVVIDDIKLEQPVRLNFYPNLNGQPYHLVVDQNNQQMVIDSRRVQQILTNPNNTN